MADSYSDLKKILADLFQLDAADLDFGIYRIMNQKREEITRFLDRDLLPQVREALQASQDTDTEAIKVELHKLEETLTAAGVSPLSSPKVQELKAKLAQADTTAVEQEVYSHLTNFFRRYYKDGDFLSLRRYKEGVYAIPYEGEEVKLHWANADQYYVKSSESFRDYTFKLANGKRVHFKLAEADTERDNNQAQNGNERRFIICAESPVTNEGDDLYVRFEYRVDPEKRKQLFFNVQASRVVMEMQGIEEWKTALASLEPTPSNSQRTLLEKHLTEYTGRNTFDYFIHKDLGGFLRRELDFFIKNEVVHLDDIENETAPRVEQYLAKVRALRRVAHKIIDFLAQIENFQKRLWLKKKFVVETGYCVTLDRVPEELYPEIITNTEQTAEWKRLFEIDKIERTLENPGYTEPLTVEFLKANPFLVLDTQFFSHEFRYRLLNGIDDIDEAVDGVLVSSENYQALSLLQSRFSNSVKCIYIDPPYNRGGNDFCYKDNYQHASWLSMMTDRTQLAKRYLRRDGALFSSIDENEQKSLAHVLDFSFGHNNRIAELIWAQNSTHSQSPTYSINHEYVEVYAQDKDLVEKSPDMFREPKPGCDEIMQVVENLNSTYPPISVVEREIKALMMRHLEEYKDELREMGLSYNEETKKQDPWRGVYCYNNVEYRDANGKLVAESEAKDRKAKIWVWSEGDASAPAQKQAESIHDPGDLNFRFYNPTHPVTGKPCPHPKTGWRWPYEWTESDRDSFMRLVQDDRIAWGQDEKKVPRVKRFLHEVETNVAKSVIHDYTDGEKELERLFGYTGAFSSTPKPTTLIRRFVVQTTQKQDWVMDYFAGSGTTGHAVINLNREDGGKRKYLIVEMGEYFDSVLKPRIMKVIHSNSWEGGKPVARQGSSHMFKYIRLESYEDALNNLALTRTGEQQVLLDTHPAIQEQYVLSYMLDVESRESASLLNVVAFEDPFNYKLNIGTGSVGESKPVTVDLVETFNYLLGLRVKTIDTIRGYRVVTGTNPAGEKVLVIWRNTTEKTNADLDDFFQKQGYNTRDMEFDMIYVNGDNNLENLRRLDETWKVRLTEEEFQRLMFDVKDV